jgi:hypothetical protein
MSKMFSVRPEDMLPLSMEDFEWGWNIAMAAASGAMPMVSPANRGSLLLEDEGEITEIRFTDTVMSRMMFAVKDHFGKNNPKWPSFMSRYWALQELQSDARMNRWARPDGECVRLFEGLMEAAATLPLRSSDGGFDPDQYFARVEAIYASGKYSHTGEVW